MKLSTGYNPSEQLTNEELAKKYLLITQKEDSPTKVTCDYMEKYGQIRTKKVLKENQHNDI